MYNPLMKLPFSIYRVSGHSMEPTIKDGALILVWQWIRRPKKGEIILFKNKDKYFVKRVSKVEGDRLTLLGDNPSDSLDSREMGTINIGSIVGKIIR